jgi:hypothetical protein
MNNQNFAGVMYNAFFKLLNTSEVYIGYSGQEKLQIAFLSALDESMEVLEKEISFDLGNEYYFERFKSRTKQAQERLFMSLLSYNPELFYPQQIDALPEASEFWEGMYQKEQWEEFDEAQHPFDRWYEVSEFHNEIN